MPDNKLIQRLGITAATESKLEFAGRLLLLFVLLYIFVIAIKLLGVSFKLMGKETAEAIFQATANPIVGLLIGVLATSIIQSSSTTTSIIVGMVGTASISFESAVPMIMGANIGTSVTNTIVSLAHISRGEEFKRAFAGATVHDFFNLCSVAVFLPLEIMFGVISKSARFVEGFLTGFGGAEFSSPVAALTGPPAKSIAHFLGDSGALTAIVALILIFLALRFIVKFLKSLILSKVENFFQRFIFRAPVLCLILGIGLTVLVQSSSISTSLVIPLIGAGVVTLRQIYPYMLGANIGTTVTAFLAALATDSHAAVSIAFAHLLFNVYGTSLFWPLKNIPIYLAEKMAELTQKSRSIALVYILVTFFVVPAVLIYILK